jgi:hypothetical protein
VCGNIVHNYFGRANPSFETIDGELWLLVDFTVGRDMYDCFEAKRPVVIDGITYEIQAFQSVASGYAGKFRLSQTPPE